MKAIGAAAILSVYAISIALFTNLVQPVAPPLSSRYPRLILADELSLDRIAPPALRYCRPFDYGYPDLSECTLLESGTGFLLSRADHRIIRVWRDIYSDRLTIGDLILFWGTPSGFRDDGLIAVYWPGRLAYLIGPEFTPRSYVSVVVWGKDTSMPWRGFVKRSR